MKHLILAAFLLAAPIIKAQTESPEKLVGNFMNAWNIKSGSVTITKDGKEIYSKGFGFSDAEERIPTETTTRYRIASVSKCITSIAVMKLVEEKKLSLDDTVFGAGKILDQPYYLGVVNDRRIYDITVRELLEHAGGWDRNVPTDGYPHNDPAFFPLHVTEEMGEANPVGDSTLIRFSLSRGLNFDPGTKYAYSNVGYLVLGKVIEKISGMDYEDYVQQSVFEPLSIHGIALGKNLAKNRLENEAEYNSDATTVSCYGSGKTVPWQYGGFNVEAMNAHGGWVASAADLTKLLTALEQPETSGILKKESIREMCTADGPNPNYAKGWSVNAAGNCWHTGSLDGTASFICRTADGYTWAFLFNARGDNSSAFWNDLDRLPWACIGALNAADNEATAANTILR
jgi:CubicO group peptidase (beta-lactamase class C family)